jgi:hypothetical protein
LDLHKAAPLLVLEVARGHYKITREHVAIPDAVSDLADLNGLSKWKEGALIRTALRGLAHQPLVVIYNCVLKKWPSVEEELHGFSKVGLVSPPKYSA